MEQVAGYPCFGLKKENATVKVEVWKGKIDVESALEQVWIKVRHLNPKWYEWSVYDQIASAFGLFVDVDWQHCFQSFYETVRLKVSCKDPTKIPSDRVFGVQGRLYRVMIKVEPLPN